MSPSQAISLDIKPILKPRTKADVTYSMTAETISITDTTKGKLSVTNDIEAVLRRIEYWHQASIAGFKIMFRDECGVWGGVRWDGKTVAFYAICENIREEGGAEATRSLPVSTKGA